MQAFEVTRSLETHILEGSTVGDILSQSKVILITDDDSRSVFIYRGIKSSLVLYFIALRLAKDIRKSMKGFYQIKELKDQSAIDSISSASIKAEGKILEIVNPNCHRMEDGTFDIDLTGKLQLDQDVAWRERLSLEKLPLFRNPNIQDNLDRIQNLEKIDGYHTEMVLIQNSMYAQSSNLISFFQERKETLKYSPLGKLVEGKFFQPGYSSRIVVHGGFVQSVEFLVKNVQSQDPTLGKISAPVLFIPRITQERSIADLKKGFQIPEPVPVDELIKSIQDSS
ncbi:hypothetical protein [Candidatus Lokiarchaeum ossiferum]|uniref:hypothetical protein n=1 Tax=Candidatus Lokiarchaeum ossiferum TaxID=2951803 RepID=UPI00352F508E